MSILYKIASRVLPIAFYDKLWRKMNWKRYSSRFEDAIQHFVIEKGISDPTEVNRVRKRLIDAFVKDNWYPDEYFFLNYDRLSRIGIYDFVPNREANRFWNYMNTREVYQLTCDKGRTYQYFKPFFQRDLVSFSEDNENAIAVFKDFVEKHSRFIVKPTFGNYGNGVRVVETSSGTNLDLLFKDLMKEFANGLTVEELIVQCAELSAFHPSSVNTVRLTTVRQSSGEIYVIHRPFIRFGQGGRCVDNGGNGGILGAIDFETGIIKASIDERMNRFVVHPNTGKTILGYRVPRWEEAKALVVELAKVLPDLNYCGWDLALTDKGWVMVEANGKGLFIGFQMPTQEGFREEYEEIKRRCGYQA